jgi:hypothetical protein
MDKLLAFIAFASIMAFLFWFVPWYQAWTKETEAWEKAPLYKARQAMREKRGDLICVFIDPKNELPKVGSKARFWIFDTTDEITGSVKRIEFQSIVKGVETCQKIGGSMSQPNTVITRSPEVYLLIQDRLPMKLLREIEMRDSCSRFK